MEHLEITLNYECKSCLINSQVIHSMENLSIHVSGSKSGVLIQTSCLHSHMQMIVGTEYCQLPLEQNLDHEEVDKEESS